MQRLICLILLPLTSINLPAQYAGHWHLTSTTDKFSPQSFRKHFHTLDVSGDTLAVFDALRQFGIPDFRGRVARNEPFPDDLSRPPLVKNLNAKEGRLYLTDWLVRGTPPYFTIEVNGESLSIHNPPEYGGELLYVGVKQTESHDTDDKSFFIQGGCREYYRKDGDGSDPCVNYLFAELDAIGLPIVFGDVYRTEIAAPAFHIHVAPLPVVRKNYFYRQPHSGYGISVEGGEVIALGQHSMEDLVDRLTRIQSYYTDIERQRLTAVLHIDSQVPYYVVRHLTDQLRKSTQLKIRYATSDDKGILIRLPPWTDSDPSPGNYVTAPVKRWHEFPAYRKKVGLETGSAKSRSDLNTVRLIGLEAVEGSATDTVSLLLTITDQGTVNLADRITELEQIKPRVKAFLSVTGPTKAIVYLSVEAEATHQHFLQTYAAVKAAYEELRDEVARASFGRDYPRTVESDDAARAAADKVRRAVARKVPIVISVI